MHFGNIIAVASATITAALTYGVPKLIKHYFTRVPDPKNTKTIIIVLFSFVVGFCVPKTFEMQMLLTANSQALTDIQKNLLDSSSYLKAKNSITCNTEEGGAFRLALLAELGSVSEKLRQIALGSVELTREETVPVWESLIRNSRRRVRATNNVSPKDWKEISPTKGEPPHRVAIRRGTVIQRIFIYPCDTTNDYAEVVKNAIEQKRWGVQVRILDQRWLKESPFICDYTHAIGTLDLALFDDECVLLTKVDSNRKIESSILTCEKYKIQKSQEFFEKLWNEAKEVD